MDPIKWNTGNFPSSKQRHVYARNKSGMVIDSIIPGTNIQVCPRLVVQSEFRFSIKFEFGDEREDAIPISEFETRLEKKEH